MVPLPDLYVVWKQQAFDRAGAAQVSIEQLFYICFRDAAVPDGTGIYRYGRTALAGGQARRAHYLDAMRPAAGGVLGLKGGKQCGASPCGAAGQGRARRSVVDTDQE
jgi:hypothetical protein